LGLGTDPQEKLDLILAAAIFLKDFSKFSQIDTWVFPRVNEPMGNPASQPRIADKSEYLTVGEVGVLLGVAKSFVYRRTSPHHPDPIPCYRFGGHLRFRASEVESWASAHRKDTQEPNRSAQSVVIQDKSRQGRVRLRVREARS
jgi:excisionase family DNA binding protein